MLWTNWRGSSKLLQALNLPNCHTGHNKSFHPAKVLCVPYCFGSTSPFERCRKLVWKGVNSFGVARPPKVKIMEGSIPASRTTKIWRDGCAQCNIEENQHLCIHLPALTQSFVCHLFGCYLLYCSLDSGLVVLHNEAFQMSPRCLSHSYAPCRTQQRPHDSLAQSRADRLRQLLFQQKGGRPLFRADRSESLV